MSAIHWNLVGHFDPRTFTPINPRVLVPLNLVKVNALLTKYPHAVSMHVTVQDGYARCEYVPLLEGEGISEQVYEFAYALARQEGCVVVENGRSIEYPPEAVREQAEVWERELGLEGLASRREAIARRRAEELDQRGR